MAASSSWLKYLGITVPLAIARNYFYFTSSLTTSFFILFPISLITYHQYYTTLIPASSTLPTPLIFKNPYPGTSPNHLISNSISIKNINFDPDLDYIWNINLQVLCKSPMFDDYIDKIIYKIITIPTLDNDYEEVVIGEGSFIINCDPVDVYHFNNWIVPYFFKHVVPPFLTDISRSKSIKLITYNNNNRNNDTMGVNSEALVMRGSELKSLDDFMIILDRADDDYNDVIDGKEDRERGYLIDDNLTWLQLIGWIICGIIEKPRMIHLKKKEKKVERYEMMDKG
ncbi:hypothetical protein G210_2439 [Candida maltosa Xu316]|uniref:Uncharacterized protein n=1 Tax=Candida maltosa (strain Xu316) TaxID=1245528 RepID=M3HIS5_CANMX|nr:hypothetical protein G210_2439 [Candida maltosa Xu316]